MKLTDLQKITKKFSKKTGMAYFEEQEKVSGDRSIFLSAEDGEISCMLRYYTGMGISKPASKPLAFHPHVSLQPDVSAELALLLREITASFIVGDLFFYDDLASDIYYGLAAEEAYFFANKFSVEEAAKLLK